jgi:hypothetical protein
MLGLVSVCYTFGVLIAFAKVLLMVWKAHSVSVQIPAGENAFPLTLTKVHLHCCSFHHFLESPKVLYQPSSQFHLPVPDSTMGRPCTTSETISYIHMLPAVPIISIFKGPCQLDCSKYHLCSILLIAELDSVSVVRMTIPCKSR